MRHFAFWRLDHRVAFFWTHSHANQSNGADFAHNHQSANRNAVAQSNADPTDTGTSNGKGDCYHTECPRRGEQ